MTTKTVRDVLLGALPGDELLVEDLLTELAEVLSTGTVWKTREIEARHLEAGDVLVARDGLLWAVTAIATTDDGHVSPEIVRGDRIAAPEFHPRKKVPILLTTTDDRALAILEAELGATLVGRSVA